MTQQEAYLRLHRLFLTVHDPRGDQGKLHKLSEILFVLVVATLAGAQNAEEVAAFGRRQLEWLRQLLELRHGIPSHDTFLTVLALVRPVEIEAVVRPSSSTPH